MITECYMLYFVFSQSNPRQRKRQDKTSLWKFLLKASQPGPDADRVSPYIRGEQGVPQEGGYKLFDKLGPYWQLHRLQESR
ncbi:hypothetical protein PoB_006820700 [Plakobranchus ocellatus]|uniref:Uncharacterized protein n=1 Tax=Plakobranchus ocellatus TaxID=259542 RepID=A0AAV4DBR7_9GAST|nr:hypothetical protein PoB_006820700 [Plakobranchus ocellatus]